MRQPPSRPRPAGRDFRSDRGTRRAHPSPGSGKPGLQTPLVRRPELGHDLRDHAHADPGAKHPLHALPVVGDAERSSDQGSTEPPQTGVDEGALEGEPAQLRRELPHLAGAAVGMVHELPAVDHLATTGPGGVEGALESVGAQCVVVVEVGHPESVRCGPPGVAGQDAARQPGAPIVAEGDAVRRPEPPDPWVPDRAHRVLDLSRGPVTDHDHLEVPMGLREDRRQAAPEQGAHPGPGGDHDAHERFGVVPGVRVPGRGARGLDRTPGTWLLAGDRPQQRPGPGAGPRGRLMGQVRLRRGGVQVVLDDGESGDNSREVASTVVGGMTEQADAIVEDAREATAPGGRRGHAGDPGPAASTGAARGGGSGCGGRRGAPVRHG